MKRKQKKSRTSFWIVSRFGKKEKERREFSLANKNDCIFFLVRQLKSLSSISLLRWYSGCSHFFPITLGEYWQKRYRKLSDCIHWVNTNTLISLIAQTSALRLPDWRKIVRIQSVVFANNPSFERLFVTKLPSTLSLVWIFALLQSLKEQGNPGWFKPVVVDGTNCKWN